MRENQLGEVFFSFSFLSLARHLANISLIPQAPPTSSKSHGLAKLPRVSLNLPSSSPASRCWLVVSRLQCEGPHGRMAGKNLMLLDWESKAWISLRHSPNRAYLALRWTQKKGRSQSLMLGPRHPLTSLKSPESQNRQKYHKYKGPQGSPLRRSNSRVSLQNITREALKIANLLLLQLFASCLVGWAAWGTGFLHFSVVCLDFRIRGISDPERGWHNSKATGQMQFSQMIEADGFGECSFQCKTCLCKPLLHFLLLCWEQTCSPDVVHVWVGPSHGRELVLAIFSQSPLLFFFFFFVDQKTSTTPISGKTLWELMAVLGAPRRVPEYSCRKKLSRRRRTTNDERRTTNDERRTTNDERRTTNDERRTTDDDDRIFPSRPYPFAGEIRVIFSRLSVRTRSRDQIALIAVVFAAKQLRSQPKFLYVRCLAIPIAVCFRI